MSIAIATLGKFLPPLVIENGSSYGVSDFKRKAVVHVDLRRRKKRKKKIKIEVKLI